MTNKIKRVGLIGFLKGSSDPKDRMPGCANYDHYYGGCLFENFKGNCAVEIGKRCGWFERAVLPTAVEIGQSLEITSQYEERTRSVVNRHKSSTESDRTCPDCGAPLPPRRRFCDKCKRRKVSNANRERQRVFRLSQRNALTPKGAHEMP